MPLDDLDPVIHAVARLRIMVVLNALTPGDEISFPRLGEVTDLTAGNLLTHLRRLAEAGYVAVEKSGQGSMSRTLVAATDEGRRALAHYRATLDRLLATPEPSP